MLLKYNSNGDILSSSQFSDDGWVEGIGLDVNINNDIYITGFTTLNSWNSNYPSYAFIGKINKTIPTSPLNVQESIGLNKLIIYPNPSKGKIHLVLPNVKSEKKIEIFSIDGRKINDFTTPESKISIEINKNGIYLILIRIDDEVITKKVIIE